VKQRKVREVTDRLANTLLKSHANLKSNLEKLGLQPSKLEREMKGSQSPPFDIKSRNGGIEVGSRTFEEP
jgi:hypothetical protein